MERSQRALQCGCGSLEGGEDSGSGIIYTGQQNSGQPANYYDIVLLARDRPAQSRAALVL